VLHCQSFVKEHQLGIINPWVPSAAADQGLELSYGWCHREEIHQPLQMTFYFLDSCFLSFWRNKNLTARGQLPFPVSFISSVDEGKHKQEMVERIMALQSHCQSEIVWTKPLSRNLTSFSFMVDFSIGRPRERRNTA
jgi:hypothetical protein